MIARIALPRNWLLLGISLVAWGMLLLAGRMPILPALCGPTGHAWASVPSRVDGMMRLTPPTQWLLSWAIMLGAMMLPLLLRPLAAIGGRGAVAGFVIAYVALWMPAIAAVALASIVLALAQPPAGALIASGIAVAWQGSAVKARCLRHCHRAPVAGGLVEGAAFAFACIGACWAAMLLPYLAGPAHLPAMIGVTALLIHDRRDAPGRQRDDRLLALGALLAGLGAVSTNYPFLAS
nr:DUF2182 domain-containing protein [Sphingomonas sp. CFBP 13603]